MGLKPVPVGFPCHLPEDSPLLPVAKDDPCYEAVMAEIAKAENRYRRSEWVRVELWGPPWEVEGRTLARLFPRHRFFVFAWRQEVNEPLPPNTSRPLGLTSGNTAIAIDKKGHVTTIEPFDNRASFGDFLAHNGVKISDPQDADLVWNAFCELYRTERKGTSEKVSDQAWRLGVTTIPWGQSKSGKRYFEVELNADLSVSSGMVQAQRPDGSLIGP